MRAQIDKISVESLAFSIEFVPQGSLLSFDEQYYCGEGLQGIVATGRFLPRKSE